MWNKLTLTVLGIFIACNGAFANLNGKVEKIISSSGINPSAVTVSVKNVKNGEVVAQHRENQPMLPASTLKLLTFPVVYETLGSDYEFVTGLYRTKNNELYLKLSADPFFQTGDLKGLVKPLKSSTVKTCKEFYIDDTLLDSEEWGEGWQWDNDLNSYMPRYSVYNIDGNLLTMIIRPTVKGSQAQIQWKDFYPVTLVNLVTTGDKDSVKISRNNNISPDTVTIEGTVAKQVVKIFPVNNPKRYFLLRLDELVKEQKFDYYGKYPSKSFTPSANTTTIGEISHTLRQAGADILKRSNNMTAETVYKIAGGKYKNSVGTTEVANEMFLDYCERHNIDTSNIRIVDGSGVSKNNIMTSNFATDFLVNEAQNELYPEILSLMAKPSEGTLRNRMLYFGENLHAKTGSLSDVSAIAGYLTTHKGETVAFDIMINDHKTKDKDKKHLEEEILRMLFVEY